MSYLVDTDRIVDGLSGRPEAIALFERHKGDGLGVSIVSLGEIYDGAWAHPRPEAHIDVVQEFLSLFTVISLTDNTMRHFGRLRALLRRQGNIIPDFDLLIAASALELDLILMTRNLRHFDRVPDLRLY